MLFELYKYLFAVALLLVGAVAFAATPPPLRPNLPPLRQPAPVHLTPAPAVGAPVTSVLTPEMVRDMYLSGTVERDLLLHLPSAKPAALTTSALSHIPQVATEGKQELRPISDVTAGTTARATNDGSQDIEPAIITGLFLENGVNVNRTTTAFTKFDGNNAPHHYFTTTTDFVNFMGWPNGVQMPLPTIPGNQPDRSSDPLLSENPYSSGAFPKRTYCVGTSYNINPNLGRANHSALTVWWTNDPGLYSWTPMVLDQADNPIFIDKPSIWTSWDQTNGTLGYTYVACVFYHYDTGLKDFQIYQQTGTSGFTLVNRQFLYMNNSVQSPMITVDPANGDVYLTWLDAQNAVIEIARSQDQAQHFGTPVVMTAQALNFACRKVICNGVDTPGTICIDAASTLMVRPNAADNSIGVVWHLREDGTSNIHTDVGFNRFQLGSQSWSWWRGIQLCHVANDKRDQWNAALDPSSDGTYIATWYDKRNDATNNLYQVFGERIHADGTPYDASDTVAYNLAAGANPALEPAIANGCPGQSTRFLGDYQDIWEWYGTWHGATIYIDASGNQDVYITRITP